MSYFIAEGRGVEGKEEITVEKSWLRPCHTWHVGQCRRQNKAKRSGTEFLHLSFRATFA